MKLFDGLYLYEIVLLILGAVLFVVLLAMLIMFALRNRSVKPLLLFFVIPIVMIGFPAIAEVKFTKDGVEIQKVTKQLAADPSNTELKTKLETLVQDAKPRFSKSEDGLVKIARAEAVLGKQEKAVETVNQALAQNPQSEVAKDLRTRLETTSPSNHAALRDAVTANFAAAERK
jgi:hypothetical protein